jgi:hypothetical protein
LPDIYGTGRLTIETTSSSGIDTAWFAIYQNRSSMILGSTRNISDVNIAACTNCWSDAVNSVGKTFRAGAITAYGNSITINQSIEATNGNIDLIGRNVYVNNFSLTTSASGRTILLKALEEITVGVGSAIGLRTNNGNITLWSDSDGNGMGPIRVRENVTFNSANGSTTQTTGGGRITLAGGNTEEASIPTGYASAPSGLTWIWGSQRTSGIQLGAFNQGTGNTNSIGFYSGGGNIVIKGQSANDMPGITWLGGAAGGTQIIDAVSPF